MRLDYLLEIQRDGKLAVNIQFTEVKENLSITQILPESTEVHPETGDIVINWKFITNEETTLTILGNRDSRLELYLHRLHRSRRVHHSMEPTQRLGRWRSWDGSYQPLRN